jgi:hypothetical protein
MRVYLRHARANGDVAADRSDDLVIDTLLAWAMGLQINVLFTPHHTTPERQIEMLDDLLAGLRTPRSP